MAPAATAVSVPRQRYRRLDTQRGIAVLAIVVFHVYQFCGAGQTRYRGTPVYPVLNSLDAAVSCLFVVFAFTVFGPVARAAARGEPQQPARSMLARQALRFLPVYGITVIVVWLLRQPRLPGDWRDLLEHLTFTQVFDGRRIFYTIGPAWAVSVAAMAYLLILAVTLGDTRMSQLGRPPHQRVVRLAGCIAGLAGVSLTWKAWSFETGRWSADGSYTTWFGPLAHLDAFAAGMAVALIMAVAEDRRRARPPNSRHRLLRGLGWAVLALAVVSRGSGGWLAVYFGTISAAGFGCLVLAAMSRTPPAHAGRRRLAGRIGAWLGVNSLGIYLWHEALILFLAHVGLARPGPDAWWRDLLVVVPASIVAGWLSTVAIERPMVRLGYTLSRIAASPRAH